MVFFTCNACGESLKKVQVEKHVNMCRGCQVLSCIDCGKDFCGDDYKEHSKCISEDQKYGGKAFEAKANKGDVKQQQWIQRVQEAMNKPGVSAKLKDVIRQVCAFDNVPRKKAKFQKWMLNSLNIRNPNLQEEVWGIIITASQTEQKKENENKEDVQVCPNGAEKQNGEAEVEDKKKKLNKRESKEARQQKNRKATKGAEETNTQEPESDQTGKKKKDKKRKRNQEDEEQNGHHAENGTSLKKAKIVEETNDADVQKPDEAEEKVVTHGKFNWKGNIKSILKDSPDQELSVKKLRKKVVAAYYSFTADSNFKTEQEVLALFNKKINNNPKFRILKDRVKLIK